MASGRRAWCRRAAVVAAVTGAACGPWQRVGSDAGPDPSVVLPQLFDPASLYATMGFFAKGDPLPFVASIRFLASDEPDSTYAVVAMSLANSALSFLRAGGGFEARYHADIVLRREGVVVHRQASDETVAVATREEAVRADESVIFQQVFRVAPGSYLASVSVRDENTGHQNRADRPLVVPRLVAGTLSDVLAVYQVEPRAALGDPPRLLLNPRATVPFGQDTLRLYVERYGGAPAGPVTFTVFGDGGAEVWTGEAPLVAGGRGLATALLALAPDRLPVGRLRLLARVGGDSSAGPALVSFSDQWAITNFEDVLTLLRYFGQDAAVTKMRQAPASERAALWRDFVRSSDPDPSTPENEALERYFRRVLVANTRYTEAGEPGWLSDRGEVYITIGEPDEVFDLSSDLQGQRRIIRWNFFAYRLTLDFVDETGFGRFRLTPATRAEYQRVLNTLRSRG